MRLNAAYFVFLHRVSEASTATLFLSFDQEDKVHIEGSPW